MRKQEGTIPLWTFQPFAVWEALQDAGSLWVDPTHPQFVEGAGANFGDSYEWLREQMRQRIAGYGGRYPWWAYAEQEAKDLDLRKWRHIFGPAGARWVRLALAVPQERVLLSCYGDWHHVLGRWFLPASDAEEQAWEIEEAAMERLGVSPYRTNPLPEPWESQMRQSWNTIFDIEARRHQNTIQANFEELRLDEVVGIRQFVACGRGVTG